AGEESADRNDENPQKRPKGKRRVARAPERDRQSGHRPAEDREAVSIEMEDEAPPFEAQETGKHRVPVDRLPWRVTRDFEPVRSGEPVGICWDWGVGSLLGFAFWDLYDHAHAGRRPVRRGIAAPHRGAPPSGAPARRGADQDRRL